MSLLSLFCSTTDLETGLAKVSLSLDSGEGREAGMCVLGTSLGGGRERGGGGQSRSQLSALGFDARAGEASLQGPGQSLALREAEVAGPSGLQSPSLNLGLGPAPQHLRDLSLLICRMSPGSTLEGSCEAWQ